MPTRVKVANAPTTNGHTNQNELDGKLLLKALRQVRHGDFSQRLPDNWTGLPGEVAEAFNELVEMNERLTKDLERISEAVGKEGKISQRVGIGHTSGAWTTAVDSVNSLITDLVRPNSEVTRVIGAVAKGDLSQTMALEFEGRAIKGEFLRTAKIVNTMVDQLGSFASEVTRVAREVGTEGKLGGQAQVKGVSGIWKDLTDSVNSMASNLTAQVRNIAEVTTSVANGDLSKKITVDVKGEILELKNTINTMVDQLGSCSSEVTRVAREVGTEGKLGGQAQVKGVSGVWKDLTDNVNWMASNLTAQVRNIAEVTTAVANGDLSRKITVDVKGEILELKNTINTMVDQLSSFASEVTRVAREVGTEGKLGGQAQVKGVSGVWKDLTDSVNLMANNLTGQVRNIAEVTTAVANGDLSKKITVESKGEILQLKNTVNKMVDYLNQLANEVGRVTRAAGEEGKLTELTARAKVEGATGAWKNMVDTLNLLLDSLAIPVTEIGRVVTAISQGDLSQKMPMKWKNEMAVSRGDLTAKMEIKAAGDIKTMAETINKMVDDLNTFAGEVTRVAREVGSDGQLGGQAKVPGVAGTWKDLTDSVNGMAAGLTNQVRDIARVATAVANGDLSKKITVDVRGEILELKNTINKMVDNLNTFSGEVTRVAKEVGTEGKLGGQAEVKGVTGAWKDLTDSVNGMAGNLTAQVRNIAEVTTAVANGDLSKKITVDVKGEILELKNTINTMVDQLRAFASEVTRVAREVGTEGKLGGQALVPGVAGTWKDLTDNVNLMAGNLTGQVRNIADVTTAVANGDLSKKITVDVKGEILELKNTINTMVDQLSSFASEVTRVAKEVGSEGKLGGQAEVAGVSGVWKDLTDSVNQMANNLTGQVRNIAEVTTAVANGDLSKKITVESKGEILQLKNTINKMVDYLNQLANEVGRVTRAAGEEGKLTELTARAKVEGATGAWKNMVDTLNLLLDSLAIPVTEIGRVVTAISQGDLSQKMPMRWKNEMAISRGDMAAKMEIMAAGDIRTMAETINKMVDDLNTFAGEVTRVAREVGSDGQLGGQAKVPGVAGTWKDLTDSVNGMAAGLTNQVRDIARVATAVANGDLSKKITVDVRGEILELKNTINKMVDNLNTFSGEVTRVAKEVGTEGKLGGQAEVKGVTGAWKDLTDNVNLMANNLTAQVRNIAEVTTAVANGDLSKKITVDVKGEILELKNTINTMVDQLSSFASEVTRVAREVGTEGKLGGQAEVRGVAGIWKALTDNVNYMASNLTGQVRNIARVVTAVANGDLKRKLQVEAKGEIAQLADTINEMIDTLATFADQVTSVAREVGIEGKLGGQANVPGAAGIWRDLTDNVNQLAANLTTQVRAIAEVATAVTRGDLTRSIRVEAQGEVAALKDTINEMIRNLKDTTQKNTEQDWLKTNLARFTSLLQGQKDLVTVSRMILSELAPLVGAQHGVFYLAEQSTDDDENITVMRLLASYAYRERKNLASTFRMGEGLVGQCAFEKERILLTDVPHDYIRISSGLGDAPPFSIVVIPVLFEGAVMAVIEMASFNRFSDIHLAFLDQLTENIGIVLNTIGANMRTEELLKQSQGLTEELRTGQAELQKTNERLEQQAATLQKSEELLRNQQLELQRANDELEDKARLLGAQKTEVEAKNREIELAKQDLEEKAEQLALTSKYKSEFLANMSHELRTPLNSLLILAGLLTDNPEGNLTGKQVEFARTIHAAGNDLLALINDILDLSKIESGTMGVDIGEVLFDDLGEYVDRSFRPIAQAKGLEFTTRRDAQLPPTIETDPKRLQQVLKNLLSNAFKFTDKGSVRFSMEMAREGWSIDQEALNTANYVVAFSVKDTGIGIAAEKHKIIFEAFQQADGTTSRQYGGTGLGLSISREIAHLLGGEIKLTSAPGEGSTFTLYLPNSCPTPEQRRPRGDDNTVGPHFDEDEPALASVGVAEDLPQRASAPAALRARLRIPHQPESAVQRRPDDRDNIQVGDQVILIIEDDPHFSQLMIDMCREKGFKTLHSATGEEGLQLAVDFKPDAITLDMRLPDRDGWTILDRLKRNPDTRHIPVQLITVSNEWQRGLKMGAFAYLEKPVTKEALMDALGSLKSFMDRKVGQLLVVEQDPSQQQGILALVAEDDVQITSVSTGEEAIEKLKAQSFDCMVLDLSLPDMSGFTLLEQIKSELKLTEMPIIIYSGKTLSRKEDSQLRKLAESIIIKDVRSPERLLDETALFLHRVQSSLPEPKQRMLQTLYETDPIVADRKVLIVDDDVRNIFALTSVLERYKMKVVYAENGRQGLELLKNNPDVDVVLMDIMMPDMDGYETMRQVRKVARFKSLPIIALTAKAMKGDREKCIDAGASDYIAKPVDPEQLISMLRIWLYR
ncbi:MAG: HAMP domain-containing protein [Candidatus Xenobia bacterium]